MASRCRTLTCSTRTSRRSRLQWTLVCLQVWRTISP
ncbi:hypothetical protein L916_14671 [Phytophthora nicotianae]|uniref:Uncharacterized protein n=1 Tax=Phytophthora nicotianae TaxID=4792 RepID=W2IHH7_PHYNI|nr:hypothetical protein L916_14671 [Phytophthora nicotianae]